MNSFILKDGVGHEESPKAASIDRQFWLLWPCPPDILADVMRPVLVILEAGDSGPSKLNR